MTTPNDPTIPQDSLDGLIAAYLDAVDAGQSPDRQDLLAKHPRHAVALCSFFADHDRMNRAAAPLRLAATSDSADATDGDGNGDGGLPRVRYFGDYELLEEIARGGMGIVYKARQASLNRTVALKMILAGQFASEGEVDRFYAEARSAARLQHPNIVAIHEVGKHENQHYFSMDYIEGKSLSQIVRESPLPADKAAGYLKTIAEAIEYAHRQGTLHRDLKPSNVLIDRFDRPQVTDFGLAKRIEGTAQLTATGTLAGTPSYMPPEQAGAHDGKLSPASDVYSLGALLYELVTGRPPFLADTLVATLNQVLNNDPVPPRLLNPKVPRDLETICLKCLEKEPIKRYPAAAALANDLSRFLRHEPITARPVGQTERLWRWCKRNRLVASLIATIAFLLLDAAIGGAIMAARDNAARKAADENAKLANEAADRANQASDDAERRRAEAKAEAQCADERASEARRLADRLTVDEGLRLADQGEFYEGLRHFIRPLAHADKMPPDEQRMHRIRIGTYLRYTKGLPWLTNIFFAPSEANLRFSPDCSRLLATSGKDLWVWDLDRDKLAGPPLHHSDPITAVRFTSDGKGLRLADGIKSWTWDYSRATKEGAAISDPQVVPASARPETDEAPGALMRFNSDGTRLAIAAGRTCRVWDVEKGVPLSAPIHCQQPIKHFAISPDGKRMATSSEAGQPGWLWDADSGRLVAEIPSLTRGLPIDAVEFTAGGQFLITSNNRSYRLWNPQSGKAETPTLSPELYPESENQSAGVLQFDISRNGKRGLCTIDPFAKEFRDTIDYSSFVIDPTTGKALGPPLRSHKAFLATAFSPDSSLVLTSDMDRTCRLWNVRTGRPESPLLPHSEIVDICVFASNGRRFATSDRNGQIRVWEIGSRTASRQAHPLPQEQFATSFANDAAVFAATVSKFGATGAFRTQLRRPEATMAEKAVIRTLPPPAKGVSRTTIISSDAKRAFAVTAPVYDGNKLTVPGGASLWKLHPVVREVPLNDPVAKSPPNELRANVARTTCAAFSQDGKRLATVDPEEAEIPLNYMVRLFDAETGALLARPLSFATAVNCVAPDATGSRWAIATVDGQVIIWDLERGTVASQAMQQGGAVVSCTFGAANALVAGAAFSNTAGTELRIWETAGFRPISPRVETGVSLERPFFARSSTEVVFPVTRKAFDIGPDSHSIADLVRLVELVSCQRETPAGLAPLLESDIQKEWNDLHPHFPEAFRVPVETVLTWYEQQIESERAARDSDAVEKQRRCLAVELERAHWRPDEDAFTQSEVGTLINRLCAWASNGRASQAAAVAMKVARQHKDANFGLARVLALAAGDRSLPHDRVAEYASESIRLLRIAEDAGAGSLPRGEPLYDIEPAPRQGAGGVYFTSPRGELLHDVDLASLHGEPEFEKLVREDEAQAKVDALFAELLLKSDVIETLKSDASLSREFRDYVLKIATRHKEDPTKLNDASWKVVSRLDSPPGACQLALRWAAAACRIEPDNMLDVNTLGVARFRTGQFADAIPPLTRSHEQNSKSQQGPQPADAAFLAMAHQALGHAGEAAAFFRELNELMKQDRWKNDAESVGFFKEAQERFGQRQIGEQPKSAPKPQSTPKP